MSEKKPSEVIRVRSCYPGDGVADDSTLLAYLDAEHERRAEFERGVLERLEKLERDNADGLIGETEHGDRVFRYAPTEEIEEP